MSALETLVEEMPGLERDRPSTLLFDRLAPEHVRHAGWLTAIGLGLPAATITDLLNDLFDLEVDQAHATLEELANWSFVRAPLSPNGHPWTVALPAAQELSASFQSLEPTRFAEAHNRLATDVGSLPRPLAATEHAMRGQHAFYLAGYDIESSAEEFAGAFRHAPTRRGTPYRTWLAGLVDRQSPLLGADSPTVEFHLGFRAYVDRDYEEAATRFSAVLETPGFDAYEAISGHLLGQALWRLQRGSHEERLSLYASSIGLSRSIGLTENEIMARQSLIWEIVSEARRRAEGSLRDDLLRRAATQARTNADRAAKRGDDLALQTARTALMTSWLSSTSLGTKEPDDSLGPETDLVEEARDLVVRSLRAGAVTNAAYALGDILQIEQRRGRWREAAELASDLLSSEGWGYVGRTALRRLEDLIQAAQGRVDDVELWSQLRLVEAQLRRLEPAKAPMDRRPNSQPAQVGDSAPPEPTVD